MFYLGKKCERSYSVTIYSVLLKRNVCYKVKNVWKCVQVYTAGTAHGMFCAEVVSYPRMFGKILLYLKYLQIIAILDIQYISKEEINDC